MTNTKPLTELTANTVTDEAVAVMRRVGERGINAEKMSWTLARIMEKHPGEQRAHSVLANELHGYLVDTASMIRAVKYLSVEIDDGG